MQLISFIKSKRKELKLTQKDLAFKSGVGLRFIRELEQGKKTLRMDKVNELLALFGAKLGVILEKSLFNKLDKNENS